MTAEELKDKYGAMYQFEAEGERGKMYQVFLRKIDRKTLSECIRYSADKDLISMAEVMIQSCMIPEISDTDILQDDAALMNASVACAEALEFKGSALKKL